MTTENHNTVDALVQALAAHLAPLVAGGDAALARRHAFAALARFFGDEGQSDDELRLAALTAESARLNHRVEELERDLSLARGLTAPDPATLARALEYVTRLRRESAEANAPILQVELDRVESLLRTGQTDVARALGEALLGRSLARSQTLFMRAAVARLEDKPAAQATAAETEARLLRHRGWTVELSADGSRIERATPAVRERRARVDA